MIVRGLGVLLVGVFVAVTSGCDKPSHGECKEACERILQTAKKDFDKRTASLPDELRRSGWLEARQHMNPMMDTCATACVEVGSREFVDCLKAAATSDEFQACTRPE